MNASFLSQSLTMTNSEDDKTLTEDEMRLAKLGYKQELKRQFSAFQNFGFTLTNASVIIGVIPLFGFGMSAGGPVAMVYGWLLVAMFVSTIGLSMAEICSTYPTAGGLYYWAGKLGGEKWGPVFSWFEAWFNILGQWAGASGSVYAGAQYFDILLAINSETFANYYYVKNETGDITGINQACIVVTHLIMIVTGVFVNVAGGTGLKVSSIMSVWVHIVGTGVIMIVLLAMAPTRQPASFVFTDFVNNTGFSNDGFAFLLGLLLSQWSQIGYDSSAHMSEETKKSYTNGPRGIILSIGASAAMGWALILALTFSIQNYTGSLTSVTGQAAAQIFLDCAGVKGASVMMFITALAAWFCGIATIAANSRVMFAFARDGGIPFSAYWRKLDPRTQFPVRLCWLSGLIIFILVLPALGTTSALSAISGISIIGFNTSYAIPILMRITVARDIFVQSEFNLGKWSTVIGTIAVTWTCFVFVLFNLPQVYPVTATNLNYAPVAVGFLLLFAGGWWVLDARKWFKGPQNQMSEEDIKDLDTAFKADAKDAKTVA